MSQSLLYGVPRHLLVLLEDPLQLAEVLVRENLAERALLGAQLALAVGIQLFSLLAGSATVHLIGIVSRAGDDERQKTPQVPRCLAAHLLSKRSFVH